MELHEKLIEAKVAAAIAAANIPASAIVGAWTTATGGGLKNVESVGTVTTLEISTGIRQYETGLRNPKEGTIKDLAQAFDVAEEALSVPDIDSYVGLMHTLFTLEDMYGLAVIKIDDQVCLRPDVNHPNYSLSLAEDLNAWCEIKEKRMNGIIRFEEYDQWRYSYPKDKALSVKASIDDAK